MTTTDDDARLEERIRAGLAGRDPGPAPAWLRSRVAAVSTDRQPGRTRLRRLIGAARLPVAATLTLAAGLFGVLLVSVLRSAATRPGTGPEPTTGPGGPTPGIDLATVAQPLALPIGWTILIGFFGVLIVWAGVEAYLRTPAGAAMATGRFRRKRVRALVFVVLVTPILALGRVVQGDASLTAGGFFEASLVHLEGMGTRQSPTTNGQQPLAVFRYVPGGTVTFVQSVRNAGRLPITILGGRPGFEDIELRLFAPHDPTGPIDVDTMPTYPFAPFALAPGEEREIVAVAHFLPCPDVPVPSVEPSPDLSGDYVPPSDPASAVDEIGTLGLAYSVLGFDRDVDVPLFSAVGVHSPTGSLCGGDRYWATPSAAPTAP